MLIIQFDIEHKMSVYFVLQKANRMNNVFHEFSYVEKQLQNIYCKVKLTELRSIKITRKEKENYILCLCFVHKCTDSLQLHQSNVSWLVW